jgi:hypothetical protein
MCLTSLTVQVGLGIKLQTFISEVLSLNPGGDEALSTEDSGAFPKSLHVYFGIVLRLLHTISLQIESFPVYNSLFIVLLLGCVLSPDIFP